MYSLMSKRATLNLLLLSRFILKEIKVSILLRIGKKKKERMPSEQDYIQLGFQVVKREGLKCFLLLSSNRKLKLLII